MSRVGLSAINIPEGVEIKIQDNDVIIKGKLGELTVLILNNISVDMTDNVIKVLPANMIKATRQSWGTVRALLHQ